MIPAVLGIMAVKQELLDSMDRPDPSIAGGLMAAAVTPTMAPPVPATMEDSLPTMATHGGTQDMEDVPGA